VANAEQAGSRMTARNFLAACLLLLIAGLVVDTLVWGWVGFFATALVGSIILLFLVFTLKWGLGRDRRRPR
jgi:Flp pilus assembly protein TadB